jgi:excisionase family DNA binding protein
MTPKLLRISEVCLALGMSRSSVYREIYAGRLNALQVGERSLRVSTEEVDRFISTRPSKESA